MRFFDIGYPQKFAGQQTLARDSLLLFPPPWLTTCRYRIWPCLAECNLLFMQLS